MRNDGVSPLIGMILGLGIIVGFIGIVQNFFVPEWMKAEEWDHYELVSSEFSYLAKIVALSSSTGSPNTVTIDMGVKHSDYPFLLTPPDTASFIKVRELYINITYYEIFPNRSIALKPKTLVLNTSAIILKPDYVYLDDVEFTYEHGYAFKRYRNANVTLTDQNMFIGDTVNIYIINTTFDSLATTQPLNLVFSPLSYGGVISVANATIQFESLNPSYWESIGADVTGNIVEVNVTNARLKIATIMVTSSGSNITTTSDISPQLNELVPLSSQLNLFVGETEKVEVMARDQFGNPITGITINASISGNIGNFDGSFATSEKTDANGIATFYFTATNEGLGTLNFEAESKQASLPVEVIDVNTSVEKKWDQDKSNTSVVVSPDFVWTGISGASKIVLKNAVSLTGQDNNKFNIIFTLYNSSTYYTFGVGLKIEGDEYKVKSKKVFLYKNGQELFNNKELNSTAWDNIFTNIGTDILDVDNYASSDQSSIETYLQEVINFLQNAPPSDPVKLAVQNIGFQEEHGGGGWKVDIQII